MKKDIRCKSTLMTFVPLKKAKVYTYLEDYYNANNSDGSPWEGEPTEGSSVVSASYPDPSAYGTSPW
jgi:hypothetical protein